MADLFAKGVTKSVPQHERIALDLFQEHRASLVDYARVITGSSSRAEDVVQDAWLRFQRSHGSVTLREPLHYLYRIVRNLAIDGNRRASVEAERHSVDVDDVAGLCASEQPSPEDVAMARSELRFILAALRELPDRTRIALEMHRFEGYSLNEISHILGISVGLAHSLVADGIKHCHRRRNSSR